MDLLRLWFWNCREAENNTFKCNLVEIIKAYKPEILVLMETKVAFSKMSNFFNRLGFTASTIVDLVGRVEGIWIIWDTNYVNVRASNVSSHVIHATVHKDDYEEWVLAAVPWFVAGDFNDYANQMEKRSFSLNNNTGRVQKFLDRVNNCNLIDLGSFGPRLTWTNNRLGLANTMDRLDRAMCNKDWRILFPEATVQVLSRTYSYHSPLMVHTQGMHPLNPLNRPFRFEATWMSHPGLIDIIQTS
ncbi:hypothetical protein ACSBR1_023452 [Camellia fascicularis]